MTANAVTACSRSASDNDAVLGTRTTTGGVRRFAPDIPAPTTVPPHGNEDAHLPDASNRQMAHHHDTSRYVAEKGAGGMVTCTDLPKAVHLILR
ncbi:hypothetical protein Adu01nite_94950 [Paractinoplanes durhamensis]|uniref:Uncharacterized protein n=1 Tax=Paractinoplanes durhamensis TaxID=113563 RepID=A0ABQ3ZEE0_9ACTN|nr:hypothetical protein Adu01nite_94950 [Actinoplanes durhamensis]